jgi:hypothetical protein
MTIQEKAEALAKKNYPEGNYLNEIIDAAFLQQAYEKGFIAGAESVSPKWVKAETDLPKEKGYYITRRPTLNNKQWIIKHVPFNPKYDDTYIHVWRFYGLEYLDETPFPSVNDREQSVVVYKDGTYKKMDSKSTWEYENDADWLTTIKL